MNLRDAPRRTPPSDLTRDRGGARARWRGHLVARRPTLRGGGRRRRDRPSSRSTRPSPTAAIRTPDATPSPRGPGWVAFAPAELDDHAADRAVAWFASAHRRLGPRD